MPNSSNANEQKRTRKRRKHKKASSNLRRNLLIILVLLPVLVIVGLQWYSIYSNDKVFLQQARQLLENVVTESHRNAEGFIFAAKKDASIGADLFAKDVVDVDDIAALENYFISVIASDSRFTGYSLARPDGSFFYISRDSLTNTDSYRVKRISFEEGEKISATWWRAGLDSERRNEVINADDGYDPTKRGWYKEALVHDTVVWTAPYVFYTDKFLGVTASKAVRNSSGELIGVIGLDLSLTSLSEYLSSLSVSESSVSFITTDDGVLIGSPLMADDFRQTRTDEAHAVNLMQTEFPVPKAAFQTVFSGDDRSVFSVADKTYLVDAEKLTIGPQKHWRIITYAERDDFLVEVRQHERRKLILALVALGLSVVLGSLLTTTAWRPVRALESQVNIDQLTGIFNRGYMQERAIKLIERAQKYEHPLSMAFIDIDHFKSINDTYGHDVGDEIIRIFAQRLENQMRALDILARFGGEEFVAVMPALELDVAVEHIDLIRQAVAEPFQVGDKTLTVSFSAGVASLSADVANYDELLKKADMALYRAKNAGRDQVVAAT